MRILLVSTNFAPEPVGIGKYSGELAAWLVRQGHEVDVICSVPYYPWWRVAPDYRGRGWVRETYEGAAVWRTPIVLPRSERTGWRTRIAVESSFALAALRWWAPLFVARRRHDLVYCVCPPLQSAIMASLFAALRRVPWVLHVQDFQVDAAVRLGVIRAGSIPRLLYAAENRLLRQATRVSTITGAMARRAVGKGVDAERVFVTPNWSDVTFVRPLPRDDTLRLTLGATPGQVLVLYAGNIGEKQGLELLLDVADDLRHRRDIAFAVVGEGAARARLQRAAEARALGNVTFHDLVPWSRVPELLAAGDVHLVIQRAEAADLVMPSKLTNVLAAGRPSIATAEPGTELHDVLSEHRTGLVVTPGDRAALVAAVTRLADDEDERRTLGANARAYAEAHLDMKAVLSRLDGTLRELVGGIVEPLVDAP